MLTQHSVDGGAAYKIAFRQLSQAVTLLAVTMDGGTIEDQGFPSDMPSFELGPPHPGAHSLDDQTALQLRDRPDDYDDRPAQGPTGVDLLPEADELYVEPIKLVQDFEEVLSGPGDTVASPDQNDVELAAAGISHHGVEPWPAGLRSGDHVGVLFDDQIAALLSHLMEVVELSLGVLIEGGDPHI